MAAMIKSVVVSSDNDYNSLPLEVVAQREESGVISLRQDELDVYIYNQEQWELLKKAVDDFYVSIKWEESND